MSCRAHPRKDSRVPEVSFQPNTPAVALKSCSPRLARAVASAPITFTSSPTQELMADGVMVLTALQAPPVECSREISGHIRPTRPDSLTGPTEEVGRTLRKASIRSKPLSRCQPAETLALRALPKRGCQITSAS